MSASSYVKLAALVPVSQDMMDEAREFALIVQKAEEDLEHAMREALIDMRDGPRLGPGRSEWFEVTRPERRARRLRRDLDRMGRAVGPIVVARHRASGSRP